MKTRYFVLFLLAFSYHSSFGQAFNDERTSAINYVKRVYSASPFEGAKRIDGESGSYFAVTVSYQANKEVDTETMLLDAQRFAEMGFTEPCVRFDMIGELQKIGTGKKTYLYLCETLSGFITGKLKRNMFDGARVVISPTNRYVVATVTLDNAKQGSSSMRDRLARMKANQMSNTLVNGSTITSESVLRTDGKSASNADVSETIKEFSMGFIPGLQLLSSQEVVEGSTTYIFYFTL